MANFSLLDFSHPEIADLLAAMLQARAAVERRSWSHPRQPTGEDWWADVLTDPRARRQFRSRLRDLRTKPAFYRLRDEPHATVLVACSKCDWKAAFDRAALIVSHGPAHLLADLLERTRVTNPLKGRASFGSLRRVLRRAVNEIEARGQEDGGGDQ